MEMECYETFRYSVVLCVEFKAGFYGGDAIVTRKRYC